MTTLTKPPHRAEAAYRKFLGHTVTCPACRVGTSCPTATQLGRDWREARR